MFDRPQSRRPINRRRALGLFAAGIATPVLVVERRAVRALGVLLAQHAVDRRGQPAAPFGVGVGDLVGLGFGRAAAGGEHRGGNAGGEPGQRRAAGLRAIEHGVHLMKAASNLG